MSPGGAEISTTDIVSPDACPVGLTSARLAKNQRGPREADGRSLGQHRVVLADFACHGPKSVQTSKIGFLHHSVHTWWLAAGSNGFSTRNHHSRK
jgi:hypothetical protein